MDYIASSEGYKPRLYWVAVSKDGSTMRQRDGYNSESIDRKNLKTIIIIDENNKIILTQHFKPGQRLIYRCRTVVQEGRGTVEKIHIIGWQQNDIRHVTFIYESDCSIVSGDFIPDNIQTDSPWLYTINFKDHDLIEVE